MSRGRTGSPGPPPRPAAPWTSRPRGRAGGFHAAHVRLDRRLPRVPRSDRPRPRGGRRGPPGLLDSARVAEVTAESTGHLTEVAVNVGDAVEAGQVLARLQSQDAELTVRAAELEVEGQKAVLDVLRRRIDSGQATAQARAQEVERIRRLVENGRGTDDELARAQEAFAEARSLVEIARAELQREQIHGRRLEIAWVEGARVRARTDDHSRPADGRRRRGPLRAGRHGPRVRDARGHDRRREPPARGRPGTSRGAARLGSGPGRGGRSRADGAHAGGAGGTAGPSCSTPRPRPRPPTWPSARAAASRRACRQAWRCGSACRRRSPPADPGRQM